MGGDMSGFINGFALIFGTIYLIIGLLGYLFAMIIIRAILGAFHSVNPRTKNYISVIIPPLLIGGYIILTPDPAFILYLALPMIFISGITLLVMNKLLKRPSL